MDVKKKIQANNLFLTLSGVFIASLVTSNLIFQKFFTWDAFGLYDFEISVGIIPYPLTFLVTDIVSEIFGRKRANRVVMAGLFASVFTLCIVLVADLATATEWSPVSNSEFHHVFGVTYIGVGASMVAYLAAQFIDVQLFHFWKKLTKGKHLWLRNNASTFTSQFVDTLTILVLLCSFNIIEWNLFWVLLLNGYLFKVIVALLDTPIIYYMVWVVRKYFKLEGVGAEIPDF
ncbi:MAG: queuosine precursor transporter [Bacteroidales bacterium]|nr:queuosine precursor transporter [Bacteroidales bacterium]MCF8403965.1 queuosine precursor transporter [Bacteroidales bacterium]